MKNVPEISYSFSRMKLLEECKKKYYYQYHAYNTAKMLGEWDKCRNIFRLKTLKHIDCLQGEVFHKKVKEVIKSESPTLVDSDKFRRMVNREIKTSYIQSKTKYNEWVRNPNQYTMIFEVYSESDISDKKKKEVESKVNKSSINIINSISYNELLSKDINILELDELKSYYLDGDIKVWLKIDALYMDNHNRIKIIDWKTSANTSNIHEDATQLLSYALYVVESSNGAIKIEDIEGVLDYVTVGESYTFTFQLGDLDYMREKILADVLKIKDLLEEAQEKKLIKEDVFIKTCKINVCRKCNFKEICS